jgi:Asp-tRNA(Asn)/Glu-tRNA(Gln) amidotransferase A subunit family amidase
LRSSATAVSNGTALARIEALNPVFNAFITITAESALAQARVTVSSPA